MIKETLNSLSDLTNDPDKNKFIAYDTNKTRNDDTSIFEDDALIDYARTFKDGELDVKKWENYKKDATNKFIRNNTNSINIPVNYSAPQTEDETGFDINKIITWSSKYPSLRLRFQDFVYCTKLGYYPNNRLVVLRKFKNGIEDSLFDIVEPDVKPIATMVTWLNHDDDIFSAFSFNEKWSEYSKGVMTALKNTYSTDTDNKENKIKDAANDAIGALLLDTFIDKKDDGTSFWVSPYGNPNLIAKTMKRDTLNDTNSSGLDSLVSFKLTFEYELRYIQDIDPSIAFVDLMSNAFHMGTSESEFKYNVKSIKDKKKDIESKILKTNANDFYNKIKTFTEDVGKKFYDIIKNKIDTLINSGETKKENDIRRKQNADIDKKNIQRKKEKLEPIPHVPLIGDDVLSSIINTAITGANFIISKYREALKAAISVDTGMANGTWHVTIGNPRAPIVSIGDLVIDSSSGSTLNLGKEFGYNDFPNSFSVTYNLKSARPRGRQELSRIFNSGRGRLYVYDTTDKNVDYFY